MIHIETAARILLAIAAILGTVGGVFWIVRPK